MYIAPALSWPAPASNTAQLGSAVSSAVRMRAVLPTPCSPIRISERPRSRVTSAAISSASLLRVLLGTTGPVMNGRDQTRTSRLISGPRSMCSASQRSNVVQRAAGSEARYSSSRAVTWSRWAASTWRCIRSRSNGSAADFDSGSEEADEVGREHLVHAGEHRPDHLARGALEREQDEAGVVPGGVVQPPHGGGRPGLGDLVVAARERTECDPADPRAVVARELEQRLDRRLGRAMLGHHLVDRLAEERILEQLGARRRRVAVPLLECSGAVVDERLIRGRRGPLAHLLTALEGW